MELSNETIINILVEVFQRRLDFTTVTLDDVRNADIEPLDKGIYVATIHDSSRDEFHELQFKLEEIGDDIEFSIVPEFSILIPIECKVLGLEASEGVDNDIITEESWQAISSHFNENTQWPMLIPKSSLQVAEIDIHRQKVMDLIDEWAKGKKQDEAERKIKLWYIKESFLPAFHDQTQKHQARQIMEGIQPISVQEAIDFIVDITSPEQDGTTIEEIIKQLGE